MPDAPAAPPRQRKSSAKSKSQDFRAGEAQECPDTAPAPLYEAHCPPLYSTMPTPGAPNRLPQLSAIAQMLGLPLLPHQRHILAVATERRPDGLPRYRQVTLSLPRQAGKTIMLLLMALDRMLAWPGTPRRPQRAMYVAQALVDAARVWRGRPWELISQSGLVEMAGLKLLQSLSDQRLNAANGSEMSIVAAASPTAGQGATVGLIMFDEAFAAADNRVEQNLLPTMRTIPDAQFLIASTAGTETSYYLRDKVDQGRRLVTDGHGSDRAAFIEWAAPADADPYDEAVWAAAVPSLGHYVSIDDLRHEAETLPGHTWRRMGLNQWVDREAAPVLPERAWRQCLTDRPSLAPTGAVVLGIDCTPNRDAASVVAADAAGRCEVLATGAGVDWLVPTVAAIHAAQPDVDGVVLLGGSFPTATFAADFAERRIPHAAIKNQDYQAACALLADSVTAEALRILTSGLYPQLEVALGAAIKSGRNSYIWGRLDTDRDITPLVALTLAWFGARRELVARPTAPAVVSLDEVELTDDDVAAWLAPDPPTA